MASFNRLKGHGLKRKKKVTIVVEDFIPYWFEIQARLAEDPDEILSIDRLRPDEGYEPTNLKVVTKSVNSQKRWWDWRSGADCPF